MCLCGQDVAQIQNIWVARHSGCLSSLLGVEDGRGPLNSLFAEKWTGLILWNGATPELWGSWLLAVLCIGTSSIRENIPRATPALTQPWPSPSLLLPSCCSLRGNEGLGYRLMKELSFMCFYNQTSLAATLTLTPFLPIAPLHFHWRLICLSHGAMPFT